MYKKGYSEYSAETKNRRIAKNSVNPISTRYKYKLKKIVGNVNPEVEMAARAYVFTGLLSFFLFNDACSAWSYRVILRVFL